MSRIRASSHGDEAFRGEHEQEADPDGSRERQDPEQAGHTPRLGVGWPVPIDPTGGTPVHGGGTARPAVGA